MGNITRTITKQDKKAAHLPPVDTVRQSRSEILRRFNGFLRRFLKLWIFIPWLTEKLTFRCASHKAKKSEI